MLAPAKIMTVEAFDTLAEQSDERLEFIGGEIVTLPNNAYSSEIAYNIGFLIKLYLYQNKLKGHVTGEGGGYQVQGERYAPDVAYLSADKQPELDKKGYNSVAPELAVEVLSPSDKEKNLRIKLNNYLLAGTTVWVVDTDAQTVEVYTPNQAPQIVRADGTLTGGNFLPGFTLAVKEIFTQE